MVAFCSIAHVRVGRFGARGARGARLLLRTWRAFCARAGAHAAQRARGDRFLPCGVGCCDTPAAPPHAYLCLSPHSLLLPATYSARARIFMARARALPALRAFSTVRVTPLRFFLSLIFYYIAAAHHCHLPPSGATNNSILYTIYLYSL